MILYGGKQYDSKEQDRLLEGLEERLARTLAERTLPMEAVIAAVDRLGKKAAAGAFDGQLSILPAEEAARYKAMAASLLTREHLEFKVRAELGEDFLPCRTTRPPAGMTALRVRAMPLGVLLHIAAGNADGLPAFSVAEGLLCGNVNILKLPSADNGLSMAILQALIGEEPALADFLYVFDTPSADVEGIKKLAALADGIAVWGGDGAVRAARRYAAPGARLIEWGHRLSFAYISGYAGRERELRALAEHITGTRQLLCSSCQTIFLDTERMEDVYAFCDEFLPILERAALERQPDTAAGAAELTLRRHTRALEDILDGADSKKRRFEGLLCALAPKEDSELELSGLFGRCPVKRLPRKDLPAVLRRKKGYLQTAGLICAPERREELTVLLARCGVTRITGAGSMSDYFAGEAHDGEYALRRYLRMVDEEVIY